MKMLIIGADAVAPELIFGNPKLFPTLTRMVEQGASASYSSYVQKGYNGSYSSEQNWASIYTGLEPKVHGLNVELINNERKMPQMKKFDGIFPFWRVLGENGYTVGLWSANNCREPVDINGYSVSCDWENIEHPREKLTAWREIQLNQKDAHLLKYFDTNVPERLYPKMLSQRGYNFQKLLVDREAAWKCIDEYHFQDSLENFNDELRYFTDAMKCVQRANPVDVMFFYTPTTDLIGHFTWYSDENRVLLESYKILDRYIGELVDEFRPEITVFLSDHGQRNFKDLIQCSDSAVQRESFAARNEVLWLKNGHIAFESYSGALLLTYHALNGTFIASGKGVRHTKINEMRTIDFYPTLLEIFGIIVPDGRSGYVVDIFDRPLINSDKLLNPQQIQRNSIALIQAHSVSVTDIVLNELYIENRFADITLIGEAKYKEIFLGNPRVKNFLPFDHFNASDFDAVYCGSYNEVTGSMRHIKVSGDSV